MHQLINNTNKEKSIARANYKQNPNLHTWSSNKINQLNVKAVKHASQIFPTINDDRKTFLLALEMKTNTNRSTTKHIGHASENFTVDYTW